MKTKFLMLIMLLVVCSSAAFADNFSAIWDTTETTAGSSNSTMIRFPLDNFAANYNLTVWWGDGTSEVYNTINISADNNMNHTYAVGGAYEINVSGNWSTFRFNNLGDRNKLMLVKQWGDLRVGIALGDYFEGCENMDSIATDVLNMTLVTDTDHMFTGCYNFTGDVGMADWDVSNVDDMDLMFRYAYKFNANISNWDVGKVNDMSNMFDSAISFNQNLSDWNVGNVTSMSNMFYNAVSFNGNISNWNTGNVTDMESMFEFASSFNQDLNNWDTSEVTTFESLFWGATSFNKNVSKWNTSNVTTFNRAFSDASSFNQDLFWNTEKVTRMDNMFYGATSFNGNISNWDVGNVTNMNNLFYDAISFNRDLNNWNTSKVSTMINTFRNATSFDKNLSEWNTSAVTSMSNIFQDAKLSTTNYDSLLIGWSALPQNSLTFNAGDSMYSVSAIASRTILNITYAWTILDGGLFNTTAGVITNQTSLIPETSYPEFGIEFISLPNPVSNISNVSFIWNGTIINSTKINNTYYLAIFDVGLGNYSVNYVWNYTITLVNGTKLWQNTINFTSVYLNNISTIITPPTGVLSANLLLRDEVTNAILNGTIESILYYSLLGGNQSYIKNLTFAINDTNISFYKINDSEYYLVNSSIAYSAEGYSPRSFIYNGALFTNTSNNATLYLANATGTTNVIFTVTDFSGNRIEDALITIQKYFPSSGTYSSVESLDTNFDGEAVSQSMVLFNQTYKFIVSYAGDIKLITSPTPIFRDEVTLKIDLATIFTNSYPSLSLDSLLTYNNGTKMVEWTFIDTSGIFQTGCLKVFNTLNGNELPICYTCNSSNSATLTCDASSAVQGKLTMQGWIETNTSRSDYLMDQLEVLLTDTWKTLFGPNGTSNGMGVFVSILFVGTSAMVGLAISVSMGIVFTITALVLASLLSLIYIPAPFLFIIAILGGVIIWSTKT